jgi:DNA-binding CsgD family transcriptional regulator
MSARPREPIVEDLTQLARAALVPAADIEKVISLIGTERFIGGLLAFAQPYIQPNFISVIRLGDDGTPLLVGTESTTSKARAAQAAKGYRAHYREDTNFILMQPRGRYGDFSTYQTREDIASFPYRRDCYDRPGIVDRRSALRKREGYALSVSFYRSVEAGAFDETHRVTLDGLLPMLLSITERHIAFGLKGVIAKQHDNEAGLAISFPSLTPRERQVTSLTLKGKTAAQIAKDLGIAETTVISHRHKAYLRLGVKSLRELMSL